MVKEAEILNAELSPNKQEAENNIEIPSQNKSEKNSIKHQSIVNR